MSKLYLTLLVMLCSVSIAYTQCPASNLTLSSQLDVDNFSANYPGCTDLSFNLTINSFGGDVTNLNELSQIESIQGNLSILLNSELTTLEGFENLQSVGGRFSIFENAMLTNTEAIQSLTSIGDYLLVFNNDALTDLNGFNALTNLGTYLLVDGNLVLQNINGFGSLTSSGGYVSLVNNEALQDLSGLSDLASIGGFLKIMNNESLLGLSDLSSLTGINGDLTIDQNAKLISIDGLRNIDPITIDELTITDNPRLMVCEAASLCSFLEGGGIRLIETNGYGCNLEADVVSFCNDVCTNTGYIFSSQTQIDNFIIDNPNCRRIYGDVLIEESLAGDIVNLNGLANIGSIIGSFVVNDNTALPDFTGLDDLVAVAGKLKLDANANLSTLAGLEQVKLVYGALEIQNNPILNSVAALNSLDEIDGQLLIDNNDMLTALNGLSGIAPTGITGLTVQNNNTLSLCAITSVCGFLGENGTAIITSNATDCNSISIVETACAALPVELISFTGKSLESSIQLDWQTASEENNSGFEIQKSTDGISWKIIGWEAGRGTTTELQNYAFTDRSPSVGDNYYRLKQIDFDAKFEFSNIVNVKGEKADIAIQIAPNPSSGDLNVSIANPNKSKMLVTLFNSQGEIVFRSQLIENELVWRKEFSLEQQGLYFVSVQIGKAVFSEKIQVVSSD